MSLCSANTIAPRKPLYIHSYALTRGAYLRGYLGGFYRRDVIVKVITSNTTIGNSNDY